MSSGREDMCTFNDFATVVPFYYEFEGYTKKRSDYVYFPTRFQRRINKSINVIAV